MFRTLGGPVKGFGKQQGLLFQKFVVAFGKGREKFPRHLHAAEGREQGVVPGHDALTAAPVEGQRLQRGMIHQGKQRALPDKLIEERGVSASPAVDGLLHVADDGERAALGKGFFGQRLKRHPLIAARVLKFVDEHVRDARAEAAEQFVHAFAVVRRTNGETRDLRRGDDAVSAFIGFKSGVHRLRKLGKGHETACAEQHPDFPDVALQTLVERMERETGAALGCLEQAVVEALLLEHGRVERKLSGPSAALYAVREGIEKMSACLELFLLDACAHFSRVVFYAAHHGFEMVFRLFRRGQIAYAPAVAGEHEGNHGGHALAYAFSGKKAVRLFRAQHLTAGAAEQGSEQFVVSGLESQLVEDGPRDVAVGKARLEVRRKVEVQRGKPHHEMQKTVDGADVQGTVASQQHVHGVAGF